MSALDEVLYNLDTNPNIKISKMFNNSKKEFNVLYDDGSILGKGDIHVLNEYIDAKENSKAIIAIVHIANFEVYNEDECCESWITELVEHSGLYIITLGFDSYNEYFINVEMPIRTILGKISVDHMLSLTDKATKEVYADIDDIISKVVKYKYSDISRLENIHNKVTKVQTNLILKPETCLSIICEALQQTFI